MLMIYDDSIAGQKSRVFFSEIVSILLRTKLKNSVISQIHEYMYGLHKMLCVS